MFVFALCRFRRPDYLGAWNGLDHLLRLCSCYSGKLFVPKRKAIQYSMNFNTICDSATLEIHSVTEITSKSTFLCENRSPIRNSVNIAEENTSLVPRRSLLPRCPREVWERAGERTSWRVSLGDVTAHGRVQDWPSRERLGTRLRKYHLCHLQQSWLKVYVLRATERPWGRGCVFFGRAVQNGGTFQSHVLRRRNGLLNCCLKI